MKNNFEREKQWLLQEKYYNKPSKKYTQDSKRIESGEPVDYVIGFTNFLGCKIDLSNKPLIPRAETEFWVEKVIKDNLTFYRLLDYVTENKKMINILDIFSGSGCIGLALLKNIINSQVTFADIDKKCISQIKKNIKINLLPKNRYVVKKSDLFENINISSKFDYIFANPPYIPLKNKNKIQKPVLKYEPAKALYGGVDGLLYIKKFLSLAKNYLSDNGVIYMEFGGYSLQKKQIENIVKKFEYKSLQFYKDQYKKWRYVEIKK